MSQAKVDRYKEEKANRKKVMRKEKIANRLRKCAVAPVQVRQDFMQSLIL